MKEVIIGGCIGIVGTVLGSIIPWVQSSAREKKKKRENANYLAAKVVIVLDKYVSSCVDVVSDDGTIMGRPTGRDGCYEPQEALPTHIIYPVDIDWKSIDPQLMYKLLNLPVLSYEADRSIKDAGEISSPPFYEEFFEERQKRYSELGLYTLQLDVEIRSKYKIPNKKQKDEWNPKKFFEDNLRRIEEIQRSRNKANEKFFKDLE